MKWDQLLTIAEMDTLQAAACGDARSCNPTPVTLARLRAMELITEHYEPLPESPVTLTIKAQSLIRKGELTLIGKDAA